MNAPENITLGATMLALDAIEPSKTNPRKTFNQVALTELTDSVKQHGVLQPILVRVMAEGKVPYELVAGERRYRAAKAADLTEIPALVRQLSDVEALELQVVENLQREDLHPLEEAEGYEALMKRHKYSADDLAAKVGKSKAFIYARLKLCELRPEARKFFYDGKFSASTALLLARVPVADLQIKAAKEVASGSKYGSAAGEPMSYRDAAEHLRRNYMLDLTTAVFDIKDATLRPKAGACGPCPKRTGNQPELFNDVGRADVCTDPVCFNSKRTGHFERMRADAAAQGRKIIDGKKAKEIFPYEHHGAVGYAELDNKLNYGDKQTIGQLAKKVGVAPVLVEKPKTGELIELVDPSALKVALRKAGLVPAERGRSKATVEAERAEKLKRKVETAFHHRVFESLRGRLTADPQVSTEDGVLVALTLWERADYNAKGRMIELYGWNASKSADDKKKLRTTDTWEEIEAAKKRIAALSASELWRLMIELSVIEYIGAKWPPSTTYRAGSGSPRNARRSSCCIRTRPRRSLRSRWRLRVTRRSHQRRIVMVYARNEIDTARPLANEQYQSTSPPAGAIEVSNGEPQAHLPAQSEPAGG